MHAEDSATGRTTGVKATGNGAWTVEQGITGGERNGGTSNNYDAVKHECNRSVVSAGTGAKNIGTGGTTPIFLMGIYIHTALVGTLTVTGFTAEDGTTAASIVIPIGAVGWVLHGNAARCETGCTVQKSSASDDAKIVVDWRPIG